MFGTGAWEGDWIEVLANLALACHHDNLQAWGRLRHRILGAKSCLKDGCRDASHDGEHRVGVESVARSLDATIVGPPFIGIEAVHQSVIEQLAFLDLLGPCLRVGFERRVISVNAFLSPLPKDRGPCVPEDRPSRASCHDQIARISLRFVDFRAASSLAA
jgi:hypothetical protein